LGDLAGVLVGVNSMKYDYNLTRVKTNSNLIYIDYWENGWQPLGVAKTLEQAFLRIKEKEGKD